MTEKVTRIIPCPQCGKTSKGGPDNPWRPFCSERCKLIDLGDWFSEKHVIPEEIAPGAEVPGSDEDYSG